jgi:hypothetical protein
VIFMEAPGMRQQGLRQQGISVWRGVLPGSCHTWPLPADATCAGVARQIFRDAAGEVGLEPDLLDDCILMASELAANTLHARATPADPPPARAAPADRPPARAVPADPPPARAAPSDWPPARGVPADPPPARAAPSDWPPSRAVPTARAAPADPPHASSELWLYLRGLGLRRELVCKIFDSRRGWRHGSPPTAASPPVQAVTGRGLQLVHEVSGGRWGHHPTRARLDGWGMRGKAVWFAVPAPLAHARLADVTGLTAYTRSADVTATRASERLSARQAARELETMLDERGFAGQLLRADQPARDLAVLSVCRGLNVWCRSGAVSLITPEGPRGRWDYADLVEAAEQTVRRHEELDQDPIAAATPA